MTPAVGLPFSTDEPVLLSFRGANNSYIILLLYSFNCSTTDRHPAGGHGDRDRHRDGPVTAGAVATEDRRRGPEGPGPVTVDSDTDYWHTMTALPPDSEPRRRPPARRDRRAPGPGRAPARRVLRLAGSLGRRPQYGRPGLRPGPGPT